MTGKIAIVTGASRGIGRAVTLRLAEAGAAVAVNYRSNRTAAEEVGSAVEAAGGRALLVEGDMSKPDDVRRLFDTTEQALGRPDIVVNSAGTSVFKPHAQVTLEDFDRVFALNTRGAFLVLQIAAQRVADGGRIIYVSTGGTAMPIASGGIYAASKAAGEQMAYALARELGPRRVTVNVVSPGVTKTDGLVLPEAALEQLVQQTPLGRLGEPADIADTIAFLTGDHGGWLNGQNVRPNGGIL